MEKNPSEVLKATAAFTTNLYKLLSKKQGNVFFSPLSLHAVLAMLFHGAEGDTAQTLLQALKSADADGYNAVITHLNSAESVKLMMANKIYGNKDHNKFSKQFEQVLKSKFLSEAELLDVTNQKESAKAVNEWVEKKTENKIKNIVNEAMFTKNLSLILINAIYFKGHWASQFEPSSTKKDQFFLDKSKTKEVQMMHQKSKYDYKFDEELDSQILQVPYRGLNTSMVIVLPSENSSIELLEEKMAKSDLSTVGTNMHVTEVHLYLPKFKMEETMKLNDILRDMGLTNIFDMKKANFGKILENPMPTNNLFVSEIIQKAFIKVDEAGTEAAAATRAGMMVGCAPGKKPQPVTFKVNRPAIFMLVATHGDALNILFYGRLAEPQF